MKESFKSDDLVTARYKTGEYVAKVIEPRNEDQAVVEVLAVVKHPTQGDLHSPNQVDVPLFHQRKALSHHEKAVVNLHSLKFYDGETVPDYKASLREAVDKSLDKLNQRDDEWGKQAIQQLHDLEKDYFVKK